MRFSFRQYYICIRVENFGMCSRWSFYAIGIFLRFFDSYVFLSLNNIFFFTPLTLYFISLLAIRLVVPIFLFFLPLKRQTHSVPTVLATLVCDRFYYTQTTATELPTFRGTSWPNVNYLYAYFLFTYHSKLYSVTIIGQHLEEAINQR